MPNNVDDEGVILRSYGCYLVEILINDCLEACVKFCK